MNVLANFENTIPTSKPLDVKPVPVQKMPEYKPDILDIVSEKIVNRRDITDTVTMPRAIFKGYLCFTAGTAVNAIAGMINQGKLSKCLNIAGSLVSIYGTFNFVKGFLIRDKELTETGK